MRNMRKLYLGRMSNLWKGFLTGFFLFGLVLFGHFRYPNKCKNKNLRMPLPIRWSNQIGQPLPQSGHLQIRTGFLPFWSLCLYFPFFLYWLEVPALCGIRVMTAVVSAFSPEFWGKHSVFYHLSLMLALGFWFVFFIKVKKFASVPSVVTFIMDGLLNFIHCFFCIDMIM